MEWAEPYHGDIYRTIRMSYEDVAKLQHARAKKEGHFYDTDSQAVEDFMVVYWAWAVREEKTPLATKEST